MSNTDPTPVEADTQDFIEFEDLVARYFRRFPTERLDAEFGARSETGLVRKNNEDQFTVVKRLRTREVLMSSLPSESLPASTEYAFTCAVADGLGGRDFGELASFLALRTGWLLGAQEVNWAIRVTPHEADALQSKAEVFFRLIHRVLQQAATEDPRKAGMGTTLTLSYTIGSELFILHAGDSRAYLFRSGELKRLTRDHTMAQLLVDAGMTDKDSELARRSKRVLVNCLGGNEMGVDVDFIRQPLRHGDRMLLCSDGLSDMVDDPQIESILARHPGAQAACDALVEAALAAGGKDNVTVVVANYKVIREEPIANKSGLTRYLKPISAPPEP